MNVDDTAVVPDATTSLRDLLAVLGMAEVDDDLDSDFAASLLSVIAASARLRGRPGVVAAHVVHAALRSFALSDGAPPEDMPVLSAPDLEIDILADQVDCPVLDVRPLPPATSIGSMATLRQLLDDRRSMPYFSPQPIQLAELATLLDTAVGSRSLVDAYNRRDVPRRPFPSAGGLQPIDVHVIVRHVVDLESGRYRYNPVGHSLSFLERGDFGVPLVEAAIQTDWLYYAPVVVALVGRLDRCFWKYGTRGYRYLNVDTGCAYFALHLAAEAMGLFGNALAAFDDDRMNELFRLDGHDRFANLLFAVGHRPSRWR